MSVKRFGKEYSVITLVLAISVSQFLIFLWCISKKSEEACYEEFCDDQSSASTNGNKVKKKYIEFKENFEFDLEAWSSQNFALHTTLEFQGRYCQD